MRIDRAAAAVLGLALLAGCGGAVALGLGSGLGTVVVASERFPPLPPLRYTPMPYVEESTSVKLPSGTAVAFAVG